MNNDPGPGAAAPFDPSVLVDAPESVRRLYDYWAASRKGRRMPRRADFDPVDVPKHLPGLILIDVEGVRPDGVGVYRYRVVGEWEVRSRGHNPTGRLVEDGYYATSLEIALAAYDHVREACTPLYEPMEFVNERGVRVSEYSILLPYSEDGEAVSQILVYSEKRE